jgi:aminoglycoside phosphotransferase (APT) family kinase protein
MTTGESLSDVADWRLDVVTTDAGVTIPVRATARRPSWADLSPAVRDLVEQLAGAPVRSAESAGTGFTPGFASRLDLADGRRIFVKAACSGDDAKHGWPVSDAYREEVRKLSALPLGAGASPVLWQYDGDVDTQRWIVAAFEWIDGVPPRRPWRPDQLDLVLAKLADIAPALSAVPAGLRLQPIAVELVEGYGDRMSRARANGGDSVWLDNVEQLCGRAAELTAGASVVHLDLRDDNVLIDRTGAVWIVDWNWPVVGAPWIDLVCLLLSARGDGLNVERLLAAHPLSRDVPAEAVDALLAVLWSFWAVAASEPVPEFSPHLRSHQAWYLAVTENWLRERLTAR